MRTSATLLAAVLAFAGLAHAQAPGPVPALPDTQRLTSYALSSSTCACSVGFAIYGDGTDIDNWLQVYVGGSRVLSTDPTYGWKLTSPSGSLGNIARPIVDAVLTFNSAQSATVTIVGARRPRRVTQFQENRGVAARDLNQAITDDTAMLREAWDKLNGALVGQPGEPLLRMPSAATRANQVLAFDGSGNPTVVSVPSSIPSGQVTGPGSSTVGDIATWGNTLGNALVDTPVLGVPHGGTGQSSLAAHGVVVGEGSAGVNVATTGTAGAVLIDQGAGNDPQFKPLTGVISCSASGACTIVQVPGTAFSVATYGAKCDGATDDTAAFQLALNAIATTGGGQLFIPSSTGCLVGSTPLTYSGQNLRISGTGTGSLLRKSATTGDLFQFSGLQNIQIDHLRVNGGTSATAGAFFNFTNTSTTAGNFWVDSVELLGGWDQVLFQGGQNTFITNSLMNFFGRYGLHYGASYAGIGVLANVAMTGITSGGGVNTGAGILVENGDTFPWSNLNIAALVEGIIIKPPASGNFVKNVYGTNVLSDSNFTGAGWDIDGSVSGAVISRIHCTACWAGANAGDGVKVNTVSEFNWENGNTIVNVGSGLNVLGTNTGVKIIGSTSEGNSVSSSGTNDGVKIASGTTGLQIIGNRFGLSSTVDVTNSQKYGLEFTGTVTNAIVVQNNLNNNVTGGMVAPSGGTGNIIRDNQGYNPVGTTAAASTGTTGATITAGPTPETHYVKQSATFNAAITKNSQALCTVPSATVPCVVELGPNESYSVAWSTTQPTYTKDVH